MARSFTETIHPMNNENYSVAIACGGTGGHLFPGLAVAARLAQRGCEITLLISPKEVDQRAVKSVKGMRIVTLPAVGLQRGSRVAFLKGIHASYRAASDFFAQHPPDAALAMGGFTSAPPIFAARKYHARTFLHESNTIPGKANRWLARVVDRAFVGFPSAAARLSNKQITITGTPVRPGFQPRDASACRVALGLNPVRPVVLVIGGSQGASGINDLILNALPQMAKQAPDWQWLHLAGKQDEQKVRQAYAAAGMTALVHGFFDDMELALGAASAAVSRAGASSLSEIAAMRVPSVLVPYPTATDDHQLHNARAFVQSGAARLLEQKESVPDKLCPLLIELVNNWTSRELMQKGLEKWQAPHAAEQIAETMFEALRVRPSLASRARPLLAPAFASLRRSHLKPESAAAMTEEVSI
jgi:UDP-N-acetylglucosamine--N-acetylmuramyl-(pentapeptide) pyrophosphoryl-undecaprenol N-acetylglucosamine transferase